MLRDNFLVTSHANFLSTHISQPFCSFARVKRHQTVTLFLEFFFPVGEDKLSYGYDSSGKKATDSEFAEYGQTFGAEDVIGCYLVS